MAQFLRPISDITVTQFNGTFADIDEVSFNDADFIWSNDNTSATYECELTSAGIIDPTTNSEHVISYRVHQIDGGELGDGGGTAVSVILSLYQGGVLIASDASRTATGEWVGYTFTLSSVEADSITDYTALRLRFNTSGGGGSPANRRGIGISWAELSIPDVQTQIYNETVTLSTDISVSDSNITNTDNTFILNINNTDIYSVGKEFNDTTTITSIHTLETDSTISTSQTYYESIILNSKIKIYTFTKKHNITGAKAIVNIRSFKNMGKII